MRNSHDICCWCGSSEPACPGMSDACGTVSVTWPTFEMSMVINLNVSGCENTLARCGGTGL